MSTPRTPLPNRRACTTFEVRVERHRFDVTIGYYADGRIGEVFTHGAKIGSDWQAVLDDASVLLSILLQTGYDPRRLAEAMCREIVDGAPSSVLGALLDHIAHHQDELFAKAHEEGEQG